MTRSLFGTDGIRGAAGEEPLTPETAARVARAFAEGLLRARPAGVDERPVVLLGHDGRASSDFLVAAIEAGLAAAGVDSQEAGLITTPGLSTLVRELSAAGGAMVTASHNPSGDNGIKLFGARGEKLDDAEERRIEESVSAGAPSGAPRSAFGRRRPGATIRPEIYLGGLIERAGLEPGVLRGMRVAFDGANGGGSELGPELFSSLGADVVELAVAPDGTNINSGVGALHPKHLSRAVSEHKCRFGVALDGDGDRAMLADETGRIVDGDGVLAACAPDLKSRGLLPQSAVVVTVMSNLGLAVWLRAAGIETDTVPVGDRPVVARLKERGLALGAEPSGHVVFGADNEYVGDGLYTALRVLELLARTKKPLSQLAAFPRTEQVLVNVRVARRDPLDEVASVSSARAAAEQALGSSGRVVLRYSGTEPLARVMVEAPDRATCERWAGTIADAIKAALA